MKRNIKNAVTFFAVVIILYVPLSIFFTIVNNPRTHSRSYLPNDIGIHRGSNIAEILASVQDIRPAENNSVHLVLKIDVFELLKNIDIKKINNGEATSNPIPEHPDFEIANADICKKSRGLKYIVYVHSSPDNKARRDNVRNTWGNRDLFRDHRTNIVFVMGMPDNNVTQEDIIKESNEYKDIVQAKFTDEYHSLTTKAVSGLKWVTQYCPEADYAIKADDDAFINIFELTRVLEEKRRYNKLVVCPLWPDNSMPILRDPNKCMKWCVKHNEFPGMQYFPKYCAGLAYTMSRDLIKEMYNKTFSTPYFWVDDVYVTGLLLGKIPKVKYESHLYQFSLKEKIVLDNYADMSQPIKYYYTHIRKPENFPVMWNYTISRLQPAQLTEIDLQSVQNKMKLIQQTKS